MKTLNEPKSALLLTPYPALLRFHLETAQTNPHLNGGDVEAADSVSVLKEQRSPMLPPFIIEQIRKREIEERAQPEQPRLELPLYEPRPAGKPPVDEEKRGVIIIEL
ncbi:hypothetical protein BH09MYX1_BH09MYX1_15640 [soil metagenome]